MFPFDVLNPKSVAILDNYSMADLFTVPPYGPDFNPAEELFSSAKYYLKEHDGVPQAMDDSLLLLVLKLLLKVLHLKNALDSA